MYTSYGCFCATTTNKNTLPAVKAAEQVDEKNILEKTRILPEARVRMQVKRKLGS